MSYSRSTQPDSTPLSTQTRSLLHLSSQLSLLSQRTQQLEQLTAQTAEHASYMRLLGASHAALFMGAQKVFVPSSEEDQVREEQH
ncbi:hypothetical protein JCM5353_002720 [Sporobolomyces roseus]